MYIYVVEIWVKFLRYCHWFSCYWYFILTFTLERGIALRVLDISSGLLYAYCISGTGLNTLNKLCFCEVGTIIVLIFQVETPVLRDVKCNCPRNHTGSKWKNWNAKIRFVFEITDVNKLPREVSVFRVVVRNLFDGLNSICFS